MSNKKSTPRKKSSKYKNRRKKTKQNHHRDTFQLSGNERKVHEDIIQRRITGGVKLSNEVAREAYFHALKQWQELPGSVIRPTTGIIFSSEKDRKSQDSLTFRQTQTDTDKGEQSS